MRVFWLAICVLALVVAIVSWRSAVSSTVPPPPGPVVVQSGGDVGRDAGMPVNAGGGESASSIDSGGSAQPSSATLRQPPTAPVQAPSASPTPDQQALANELMDSAERDGAGNEDIDDALGDDMPALP